MRILHLLAVAFIALSGAVAPACADQLLGQSRIDNSSRVLLPGGPTLGRWQNGRYTATPDTLELKGPTTSVMNSLVTTQTTPGGSVGEGSFNYDWTRTGGYGQYGNGIIRYQVTTPTPAGQFDVALTAWGVHTNLTGGSIFGGWLGANTPSSGNNYSGVALNQTFSGGAAIGAEINVGNRWADFGLQMVPGARYTVGLQLVPDILPAKDGPTTAIYPGTYGLLFGASVGGNKWWVNEYTKYDTLMAGGVAYLVSGGTTAASAPKSLLTAQGYWQNGIDFSAGSYSDAVLKFSSGQVAGSATVGGGQATPATVAGYIIIKIDGTARKIPYYAN